MTGATADGGAASRNRLPVNSRYGPRDLEAANGSADHRLVGSIDQVRERNPRLVRSEPDPTPCHPGRRATTSPAFEPGARPPAGGRTDSGSSPARAMTQAITEFEFHISPVAN